MEVENDKKNNISPAVLCLCHNITDIHFAMFQDQCTLLMITPDCNLVGKAFECAIRERNGAAETVHGNTVIVKFYN